MPKLRGGAAAGTGIKTVLSDEREIQSLISILRFVTEAVYDVAEEESS